MNDPDVAHQASRGLTHTPRTSPVEGTGDGFQVGPALVAVLGPEDQHTGRVLVRAVLQARRGHVQGPAGAGVRVRGQGAEAGRGGECGEFFVVEDVGGQQRAAAAVLQDAEGGGKTRTSDVRRCRGAGVSAAASQCAWASQSYLRDA